LISNSSLPDKENIISTGYGHIGDGNIHLNVSLKGYQDESLQKAAYQLIDPFVMDYVRQHRGSVSAEHGVGVQKPKYLNYSKTKEAIDLMKQIKSAFDPNGIMNPYKVIPD
jgi:FAD/FMN-containing dehydrogenase